MARGVNVTEILPWSGRNIPRGILASRRRRDKPVTVRESGFAYKRGMKLDREEVAAALGRFDRREVPTDEVKGESAVAITLVPAEHDDVTAFVLTRRSSTLRSHKGQWAFPGGRLDPGESAEDAVLREFQEEIGIELAADRVLGRLDGYATRSGYCITPFVIWAADLPFEPHPNADEVASVHCVPVVDIDVDPTFTAIPESDRPVIRLPLFGSFLHAPTAAILYQFREVVLRGRATRVANLEQPVFAWK